MTHVRTADTPLVRPHGRNGKATPYRTSPLTDPDDELLLPWPYAIVPGPQAVATVRQLRRERSSETAVVLGSVHDVGFLLEGIESAESRTNAPAISEILAAAQALDIESWLEDKGSEGNYSDDEPESVWDRALVRALDGLLRVLGGERNADHGKGWGSKSRFTGPGREIIIGLVPTADPTEIPAYLRFGNFNSCEAPEYHVAVAHHWRNRHRAELLTCTHDSIEFFLQRPIRRKRSARKVAKHHERYCGGLGQMYGETHDVASAIRNARFWHLWWD